MLKQWQDELDSRFGLRFEILDRDYVERIRRERGYAVNPWDTFPRFLVSQRLLIDEAYAAPMRVWLDNLRPGSLLILDEAHHAAPASGSKYAIDSKITRAIRDLAPRFEHRLFLSATPHNGHSNSFSALLELLDDKRFMRGVPVLKVPLMRLSFTAVVHRRKVGPFLSWRTSSITFCQIRSASFGSAPERYAIPILRLIEGFLVACLL